MPNFVGFDAEEIAVLQRVHVSARQCVEAAIRSMVSATESYMIRYNTYFGSAATADGGWGNINSSNVNKTINAILVALKWDHYEVVWEEEDEDDPRVALAEMHCLPSTSPFGGRNGKNIIDHNAMKAASFLKMKIFPPFFDADFYVADGTCQLDTYLHELSHHAGGTLDVVLSSGADCYGIAGVRAAINEGKAHLNASNFGMFLTSFYTGPT